MLQSEDDLFKTTDEQRDKQCDRQPKWMSNADLPLPDPYPEYITCPHCGEEEIEVFCYQHQVQCHACGAIVEHTTPYCFGTSKKCKGTNA